MVMELANQGFEGKMWRNHFEYCIIHVLLRIISYKIFIS